MAVSVATWALYHRWDLVVVSIGFQGVVLGLFLATSALPRRRLANAPNGMLAAFLVALYTEMYGLPLTLYLLQPLLPGRVDVLSYPPPLALRLAGSAIILAGFMLVFLGWRVVHRSRGRLVESGIYGRIRHPQYVGLALLTLGELVQWPTLTGIVLWPLLVVLYRRLAAVEDREVVALFGRRAVAYQRRVPAFVPRLRRQRLDQAAGRRVRKESMDL